MHVIALTTTPVSDSYQLDNVLRYIYEPEELPEALKPEKVALMEKRVNVKELKAGQASRLAQVFVDSDDPVDRLMLIVPQADVRYLSVLSDVLVEGADCDMSEDHELLVTFIGNILDYMGLGFTATIHDHVGVLEVMLRNVSREHLETIVSEFLVKA